MISETVAQITNMKAPGSQYQRIAEFKKSAGGQLDQPPYSSGAI